MSRNMIFFLCPKCFTLREGDSEPHHHGMIRVDASKLTEEQRKPLFDEEGKLVSRAPKWFLKALEDRR